MLIWTKKRAPHPKSLGIGALAALVGSLGSIAVHAEIIAVPSAASSNTSAAIPPPTVLRGSPPRVAEPEPVPICPPGYTFAPGYGCTVPSIADYASGWPNYDYYWPDSGWGDEWFSGFRRSRGFARFRSPGAFPRFAGFHRSSIHGFGLSVGHIGGLGRR